MKTMYEIFIQEVVKKDSLVIIAEKSKRNFGRYEFTRVSRMT